MRETTYEWIGALKSKLRGKRVDTEERRFGRFNFDNVQNAIKLQSKI